MDQTTMPTIATPAPAAPQAATAASSVGQLRDAIQWAKQNPNDPRSVELANRIQSGQFDSQARTEGIDLSGASRTWASSGPKASPPPTLGDKLIGRAQDFGNAAIGEEGPLSPLNAVGAVAGAANDVIGAVLSPVLKKISDAYASNPALQQVAQMPQVSAALDSANAAISNGTQKYSEWAAQNPSVAKTIDSLYNIAAFLPAGKGVETAGKAFVDSAVGDATKSALESVAAPHVIQSAEANVAADAAKIADSISPKLTASETRAAINEGRVTRGSESAIFGKKPDVVAPAPEVQSAAATIARTIPDAAKLNDAQLSSALDSAIGAHAEQLQTAMHATPIGKDTTGKAFDLWNALKAKQAAEPEFDAFAGSAKFQARFQSFLDELRWDIGGGKEGFKTPTEKNLADVWDVRKRYDASISDRVKQADSSSDPSLQFQKDMWLQNRSVLNSVIHDASSGLGTDSRQAFSDMADMYLARENIASKAKIDTTGTKGILPNTKMGWAKAAAAATGGVLGLDWLRKKLGL